MLKQLAERREHEREVLHKALEENNNFSRLAEEAPYGVPFRSSLTSSGFL